MEPLSFPTRIIARWAKSRYELDSDGDKTGNMGRNKVPAAVQRNTGDGGAVKAADYKGS